MAWKSLGRCGYYLENRTKLMCFTASVLSPPWHRSTAQIAPEKQELSKPVIFLKFAYMENI